MKAHKALQMKTSPSPKKMSKTENNKGENILLGTLSIVYLELK
jgi:hypothetical protein